MKFTRDNILNVVYDPGPRYTKWWVCRVEGEVTYVRDYINQKKYPIAQENTYTMDMLLSCLNDGHLKFMCYANQESLNYEIY